MIKFALPKGRLLRKTAAMLQKAGWDMDEYHSKMGFYRPKSGKFHDVLLRVFHEKDIPIQIAMGNYDLGICCLDWVEELLARYPSSEIIKVTDLRYGAGQLYMAGKSGGGILQRDNGPVRIATEYPNLAGAYALKNHFGRFAVFPVWGAAEAYPPENADMALLSTQVKSDLARLDEVMSFSAYLIANRHSWESKHLDKIVTSICDTLAGSEKIASAGDEIVRAERPVGYHGNEFSPESVRLGLPDGHQQQHVVNLLNRAAIGIEDYPSEAGNRRPKIALQGVAVKVIRPQDMPLQVANGNFDLAITGRDWLEEHLAQFPSSPVAALADLRSGKVRLVAVVSAELPVSDIGGLRRLIAARDAPFRVASEYVNIADKYARDNLLGRCRVIPTWGATEAFLPEDADMLVENTETGRTLARHGLKIIDTLFESTGYLIGHAGSIASQAKRTRIEAILNRLKAAVEGFK